MLIQQALSPEAILLTPTTVTRNELIAQMCERLASDLRTARATIQRAVLDREAVRTTALPNQAAIPHCRLPDLGRFGISLAVLNDTMQWDDDGQKVDVVLMIAGPAKSVSDHLRILANSSQLLDSNALRAKLKRAPDARSAHELIAAAEEVIEQRRSQDGVLREIRNDAGSGRPADALADVANRFDW